MNNPEIESLKADVGRLEAQVRTLQEQLVAARESANRSKAMADAAVGSSAGMHTKIAAAENRADDAQRVLDNERAAHRAELKRAHDREEALEVKNGEKDRRIAELLGKGGGGVVRKLVKKVRGGK